MNNIWFGDYNVHIRENIVKGTNEVFLFKHEQHATIFVRGDGTCITVQDGDNTGDDKLAFAEMSNDQLAAFAQALADKGIKTNKDSIAEGKLAATEKHLEDMRLIALKGYQK
jgi:hypothetical protein